MQHTVSRHTVSPWAFAFLSLLLLLFTLSPHSVVASGLDPALKVTERTNQAAQKSQKKIDEVALATKNLNTEFKTIKKEIEGLLVYNSQLERQITNQEKELIKIQNAIDQVVVMERQIMPLMLRMINILEEFIALDIPFQKEERKTRIDKIKSIMDLSDITVAEKFRKVLEAYAIESDFGRTIEYYPGTLEIEGKPREVDFLRIGRIALVYQSLDEKKIGIWNKYLGAWQPLNDAYKTEVKRGLKIAKKQLTPKLLELPIPTPEVAR